MTSQSHKSFGQRRYIQKYSSDSPKGMDDKPSSHRQPRLSSTSHARPASMQLPSVQKASSQMSHTPLPLVGMNSMYRVKDTGTPPKPSPTQNRKKMSHYTREIVHQYLFGLASNFWFVYIITLWTKQKVCLSTGAVQHIMTTDTNQPSDSDLCTKRYDTSVPR